MTVALPSLDVEREYFAAGTRTIIAVDEVGRGAIAGPVAVGLAVVLPDLGPIPDGLRDSKLLAEPRRVELVPRVLTWVSASAVGLASADEVDRLGIIACLGLAAKRALADLFVSGIDINAALVLLDGSHDWLSPALSTGLDVRTRVKADRDCASVSAASVIAKVHRDQLMIAAATEFPPYGWEGNKGYGSASHYAAIAEHGPSRLHRHTWLKDPALAPSA